MRQIIIIFILAISLNTWGQCDNTVNGKLTATYICCNSSPNDTSFSFLYYYNQDHTLDRIENYIKNELSEITKFVYDTSGSIFKRLFIAPQTYSQLCGGRSTDNCLSRFKDRIYRFDSLTNIYYIIFDEDTIKSLEDSVFQDSKLVALLVNGDTLHTYAYDKKNKLNKTLNYCNNKISSWTKYRYKDLLTIEYEYRPNNKRKPYLITKIEYNSNNQSIKKTRIYRFPGRIQPANNYITEKYTYSSGRLIIYESYDDYIDPCFNMYCCGRYKKYYVYED